jgi:hypothetical protein
MRQNAVGSRATGAGASVRVGEIDRAVRLAAVREEHERDALVRQDEANGHRMALEVGLVGTGNPAELVDAAGLRREPQGLGGHTPGPTVLDEKLMVPGPDVDDGGAGTDGTDTVATSRTSRVGPLYARRYMSARGLVQAARAAVPAPRT